MSQSPPSPPFHGSFRLCAAFVIATLVTLGCRAESSTASAKPSSSKTDPKRSPTPDSIDAGLRVTVLAKGLDHPWGIAFLPDGRLLVTERSGSLRILGRDGRLSAPVTGTPRVFAEGQGGLLDVAVDPQFSTTGLVYLSFAEAGEGGAGTAAVRGKLVGNAFTESKVIYRQAPKVRSGAHFGSRIVVAADGALFITQGERFSYSEQAQDLSSLLGKIVRINSDGSIPKDNPFVGKSGVRPEIWSFGHRNVQAAVLEPGTGKLWTVEHGARGGDELNHPERGKNYGWPVISYGRHYTGLKIGEGTAKQGMEQPVYYWDPVIAPSGMEYYTGNAFPQWKGSFLVGSLTPGALVRLTMKDGRVAKEERYLGELGERIRDVQQGPDGFIYLITDSNDGKILRVQPRTR